jgi:2-keto-3-deoxy-L-rhamnonate aldolase RhmA
VRDADDIIKVRKAIAPLSVRLVAKIETLSAIDHLDDIIAVSGALMVARGTSASSARSKTCRTCRSTSCGAVSAPACR